MTEFQTEEKSITHTFDKNGLLSLAILADKGDPQLIMKKMKWLVFKVKQKAKQNYYDKVVGEKQKLVKSSPYSHNWPYDYFSLVELAKIEAKTNYAEPPVQTEPSAPTPVATVETPVRSGPILAATAPKRTVEKPSDKRRRQAQEEQAKRQEKALEKLKTLSPLKPTPQVQQNTRSPITPVKELKVTERSKLNPEDKKKSSEKERDSDLPGKSREAAEIKRETLTPAKDRKNNTVLTPSKAPKTPEKTHVERKKLNTNKANTKERKKDEVPLASSKERGKK